VEHYNTLYGLSDADFAAAAELLALGPEDFLVDFGCGNGAFLEGAARLGLKALGLDISSHQVLQAVEKLRGNPKVEVLESAFLDFDPGQRMFTKGFSRKALHHLDNGQKAVFFEKIGRAFKPGALFLLEDGMFTFPRAELESHWTELMAEAEKYYGAAWQAKKTDVQGCFRDEFPAGEKEWLSAMAAGGFKLHKLVKKCSFYGSILAIKNQNKGSTNGNT